MVWFSTLNIATHAELQVKPEAAVNRKTTGGGNVLLRPRREPRAHGTEASLKRSHALWINSVGRKTARTTAGFSTSRVAHDKSTRNGKYREKI